MKVAALVPFKGLTHAKRRLRDALPADQVEILGRTMLEDVLAALLASSVDAVYVLSEDPAVAALAREAGADALLAAPDPGLNGAIDAAERALIGKGFGASLVALGDLPLLRSSHVETVLAAGRTHAVVIVPAADGGTSLLWRRPPGVVPARFGPDSADAHARKAALLSVPFTCLTGIDVGARADLDTLSDAKWLIRSGHASRTSELLRKLLP